MPSVTVIISRSNDLNPDRRSFEDALAKSLHANGCDVLLVPHVYYLASKDEAVSCLTRTPSNLVVAAWLYPRATRWTLDALGIDEKRIMKCHDLRTFSCPKKAAADIRLQAEEQPVELPSLHEVSHPIAERWYPIIDYSHCVSCKQCFGFCLFGVYSVEADRVIASSPNSCKNGCPACARVCPEGAIIFPHCDDTAIAGAPGSHVSRSPDPVRAVLERARRKRNTPPDTASHPAKVHQANELDDLINALEDLDD